MKIAAAAILAGCGSTPRASGLGHHGPTTLVLGNEDGSPGFTANVNPMSVNANEGWWFLYEPLYELDSLTGAKMPWLATSYKWVSPIDLQFTIRHGVRWSNGKPFTPADVVSTFDLLKRYSALDLNGVSTVLSGVSAAGDVVAFRLRPTSRCCRPVWIRAGSTRAWPSSTPTTMTRPRPTRSSPPSVTKTRTAS